ncbi:MAG: CidA/LrgA family protein [Lachnospiraceae bacterium]|nr:CidA/LrgA family protein [Lachnospiraceae bacterium]
MRYLKQFGIILFISCVGELVHWLIPLPVPASIYGLVFLLLALITGILKLSDVKEVSVFLIEIMPVMFIPAAVGLMTSWKAIRPHLIPYIVITVVSLVAVMAVSGRITQAVLRRGRKKK